MIGNGINLIGQMHKFQIGINGIFFFILTKKKKKISNHAYRACDASVCISSVHDQIHGDIF